MKSQLIITIEENGDLNGGYSCNGADKEKVFCYRMLIAELEFLKRSLLKELDDLTNYTTLTKQYDQPPKE